MSAIEKACYDRGWEVCASERDENVSGVVPMERRPGLMRLHAQAAGKVLVVYSLDRLARAPAVGMYILEKFCAVGCPVVAIVEGIDTRTGYDKERVTRIFEHAAWERQMISTRVKEGMAKRKGTMNPCPPYGYRWVGKNEPLQPVHEEQACIAFIRLLKEEEPDISCRALARILNIHPEFPRRGLKEWSVTPIQNIMERHGIPFVSHRKKSEGTLWKPKDA